MQSMSLLIDFGFCLVSEIIAVNLKVFNVARSSRKYNKFSSNNSIHVDVITLRNFLNASHFIQKITPLHHASDF